MTLYDFIGLEENDKAQAAWNGVFLETRTDGKFEVLLYDLGGFYVEVYYSPTLNKIERLRPFRSVKLLEPYLTSINFNLS